MVQLGQRDSVSLDSETHSIARPRAMPDSTIAPANTEWQNLSADDAAR